MKTEKFYRQATVSRQEAVRQLFSANPNADLISFTREGNQYAAEIRVADFPPKDDGGEAPEPESNEEEAPEESDSEESSDSESKPPFGDADAEGEGKDGEKHHKVTLDDLAALVHQVLKKVDMIAGPGADDMGAGLDDPNALPDVGAPPEGGSLPPVHKPALPPPASPHGPMGGAFASKIAGRSSFPAERQRASKIGNRGIVGEAHKMFPGYRVAKLDRQSREADDIAVLTMVKR